VHFHSDNSGIFIEVADNGKGIEKEKILNAKSFGLLGMRERANMFGGSLTVEGTPGIGTRLAAKFPSMEKINLVYDN
jgi:signal transduction histidine kinase